MRYRRRPEVVEVEELVRPYHRVSWMVTRADGYVEYLTDQHFRERYEPVPEPEPDADAYFETLAHIMGRQLEKADRLAEAAREAFEIADDWNALDHSKADAQQALCNALQDYLRSRGK